MTAKQIIQQLHNYHSKSTKFRIHNAYVYKEESDFLAIGRNDYSHEIEVKISRSDFKADFNKVKHSWIERMRRWDKYCVHNWGTTNTYCDTYRKSLYVMRAKIGDDRHPSSSISIEELRCDMLPNKFSFCVPKNLIDATDIPEYAGLYYIHDDLSIEQIKPPKFIHKEKFSHWENLAVKYYYRWLNTGCLFKNGSK